MSGCSIAPVSIPPAPGGSAGGGPLAATSPQPGAPQIDAGTLSQLSAAVQQLADGVAQLKQVLDARAAAAGTGGGGPDGAAAGNACMGADGQCTMHMGGAPTAAPTDDSPPAPPEDQSSPPAPTTPAAPKPPPAPQQQGKFHPGNFTPNQVNDSSNKDDGKSACGPAAAVALARYLGKDPSMDSTIDLARSVGWTRADGMAGPQSELKLLKKMGINAHLDEGAPNWEKIKQVVQSGKPVIIGTPGHYWVAEKYDPATGKFDFGQSGSIFRSAKGKHWYSPEEMVGPGKGAPRATFYLD